MSLKLTFLLLAVPCIVQAQVWRLESSTNAAPLGHGAVFVVKTVNGPVKAELKLAIFDEKDCRIRVVANTDVKTARPLHEMGRAERALAVCNGGYFHAAEISDPPAWKSPAVCVRTSSLVVSGSVR
jgi:hypothetical protein